MKQLSTSMHKTELELKKDQLVSSAAAIGRLQDLHKIMSDSLKYTKRLVSFMVFDQEASGKQFSMDDEDTGMPPKMSIEEITERSEELDSHEVGSGIVDKEQSH